MLQRLLFFANWFLSLWTEARCDSSFVSGARTFGPRQMRHLILRIVRLFYLTCRSCRVVIDADCGCACLLQVGLLLLLGLLLVLNARFNLTEL